jgi:hypothetical protein
MRSKIVFAPKERSFSDVFFQQLPIEAIDLDYHVCLLGETKPWNQCDLDDLMSKLYMEDMDFDKPLWRFFVINNMADGRHMLIAVVDHAIGDGASMINILLSVLDEADGRPISKLDILPHRRERAVHPTLLRRAAGVVEGTFRGIIAATFPPDPPNSLKLATLKLAISERRCATTSKISLAEVKAIRCWQSSAARISEHPTSWLLSFSTLTILFSEHLSFFQILGCEGVSHLALHCGTPRRRS